MRALPCLCLTALLAAGGCEARDGERPKAAATVSAPVTGEAQTPPTQLRPVGEPATLTAVQEDGDFIQGAASVDRLERWQDQNAKLFGVFGGDPAMNGLHTYLAVFVDPDEGWRLFQVGDFLDFEVLSASRGRIDLEITESRYDEASGNIGSGKRRLILTFNPPTEPEWAAPTMVTMTAGE